MQVYRQITVLRHVKRQNYENIFPVVLPAAHAGKQVAGTRSATQGSSGGKFDYAKSSLATEPQVRPDRQWGTENPILREVYATDAPPPKNAWQLNDILMDWDE